MDFRALLFELLVDWITNVIDRNWDGIIDISAREAIARGYDPDTITDEQLGSVMAHKIRESNFLGDQEPDFFAFCLKNTDVNWGERIKARMRKGAL